MNDEHDDHEDGDQDDEESSEQPDFGKAADEDVKRTKLRMLNNEKEQDDSLWKIRFKEPNLIRRGAAIAKEQLIEFPDTKCSRSGESFVVYALPTDNNRWTAFDILFGNGEDRPHIDTFSGRLVDHKGCLFDERYPVVELTRALDAMGLKAQSSREVKHAFREWIMMSKSNDLIKRFNSVIPEWDGVPRMAASLIKIFECNDTELNQEFSVYFWLSLYRRVTDPGCYAPMVLCLIGDQFTGKSHFASIVCQTIIGDDKKSAARLDLENNIPKFLRQITGNSIIANVGEMTGYNRGDLNKIKDFITRTSDGMDFKWEPDYDQPRQWIIIMDGNKYDGLQRDETGNRRFYPLFVGEKHDEAAGSMKEKWTDDYCASIAADIWPIMAECRAWLAENGGNRGYNKFVNDTSYKVLAFSKSEMEGDKGTIRDEDLDTFLIPALLKCEARELDRTKNKGIWISTQEIVNRVSDVSRKMCRAKMNHLPTKMKALGADRVLIDNFAGYLFRDVMIYSDLVKRLKKGDVDDTQSTKDRLIDPNLQM
jgi:Virulence-associated protein E